MMDDDDGGGDGDGDADADGDGDGDGVGDGDGDGDDDDDAGTLSDVDPSIKKTWELLYINPNMRYLTLIALIIHFSSIHYTGAFFAKEVIM